jgi:E3 ubiquitin-protein ligase TRIP12
MLIYQPQLSQKVAKIEQVNVEDLALDFTIPGYDIELRVSRSQSSKSFTDFHQKPDGRNIPVTSENVNEYIAEVLDAILGKGAVIQAKAFREGFSKVFPIADLRAFSADELVMLFGNSEEDWSTESEQYYGCDACILEGLTHHSSPFRGSESRPWI